MLGLPAGYMSGLKGALKRRTACVMHYGMSAS